MRFRRPRRINFHVVIHWAEKQRGYEIGVGGGGTRLGRVVGRTGSFYADRTLWKVGNN